MPTLALPALPSRARRTVLRAALFTTLAASLGACAAQAGAQASPIQLEVVDRQSGDTLPLYRHQGKSFVAGVPGGRYALRLSNRSSTRVLVVLSVDGVNVVSGETAGWNQTGYVIEPWQTHDITGWRKSYTAIAAFEFAALQDSYAAQTGRPANVGVIGAAVFLEKPLPPPIARRNYSPEAAAAAAPAPALAARQEAAAGNVAADAAAAKSMLAPRERLGTGHGQQEWSVASRTRFERASSSPAAVVEIGYDSYDNLLAAGVIPRPVYALPRSFPQNGSWQGYVPDPPRR